jgi:protease I
VGAKDILMLVGDYVEDYEAIVPYQALQLAGHKVYSVCPAKKAGDQIRTSIRDYDGAQTYSERAGHTFTLNATFSLTKPEDYHALVIPGGRAPEYLRLNQTVIDIVRHFAQANKPIACSSHGIQILIAAGVLQGKSCTAYPALRPDVTAAGATWIEVPATGAHVDGNLVTAPAWTAHTQWLARFLELLGTTVQS